MNVAELQTILKKIIKLSLANKYSIKEMELLAQLNRMLDKMKPETELNYPVLVVPFLKVTNKLYEELTNRYDEQKIMADLLFLLTKCSRWTRYAEPNQLDDYPRANLSVKIGEKKPQEREKLEDTLFLLRTTFYLIHKHCTKEQLTLLPFLIYFRTATTDEERRSELAIFNWLLNQTTDCLNFFITHKNHINMRSLQHVRSLTNVFSRISKTRTPFIKETEDYAFLWSSEQQSALPMEQLLDDIYKLLETVFASQPMKNYNASIDFANSIKALLPAQGNEKSQIVHLALYSFSLNQYKKLRKEDPNTRYSFFSLSGVTKEEAVNKKQLELRGRPVKYNVFETIALKEGRLGELVASYEKSCVPPQTSLGQ